MSKTETKAMSLGDHMRRFDEEVDRLARVAGRIDEEMVRADLGKPEPQLTLAKAGPDLAPRWPGASIVCHHGRRFSPAGQLLVGARYSWHAAWIGEVEARFDQSPLLRPLLQQYAERLAAIETVLNMGLQPVKSDSEARDEPPFAARLSQSPPSVFEGEHEEDRHY